MLSCSGRRGAYALPISIQLSLCFFYDSYLVPVSSAFRFVDQRSFKFATFTIVLVSKLNVLRFSPLIIVSRCNAGILAKRAFANIRNIGSERGGEARKFVVVRAENQQQLLISFTLVFVPRYEPNSSNGKEVHWIVFMVLHCPKCR